MIIITDKPGQLCNRLWAYSPFIAFSLKHNHRLWILHFDDYHQYFEDLERYSNIRIGVFNSPKTYRYALRSIKLFQLLRIHKCTSRLQIQLESKYQLPDLIKHIQNKNTLLITKSWLQFPVNDIMLEYKDEIRKFFSPDIKSVKSVNKIFEEKKRPNQIIVGVHMRRSDYKYYMNGRYYFSDRVYLKAMTDLQKQIKKETGKETSFLLCSDSPVNMESFDGLNTFQIHKTSAIKDLYALSKCDYIAGPPSTFSRWASYYGDVPLRFITSTEDRLQLSEFSPIVAQNRFKNGTIFSHESR